MHEHQSQCMDTNHTRSHLLYVYVQLCDTINEWFQLIGPQVAIHQTIPKCSSCQKPAPHPMPWSRCIYKFSQLDLPMFRTLMPFISTSYLSIDRKLQDVCTTERLMSDLSRLGSRDTLHQTIPSPTPVKNLRSTQCPGLDVCTRSSN